MDYFEDLFGVKRDKENREFRDWYAGRKAFYERVADSQVQSEAWQVWWLHKHVGMAQIQSLINEEKSVS